MANGRAAASRVIPDQRRERMLRALRREKVLSVHQLTDLLAVSHMTVRRDIAVLEQEGLVSAVPGGVRLVASVAAEPSRESKSSMATAEKAAIAALAAQQVTENMVVYLDAGTTTLALARMLVARPGITIVTNDFGIVDLMADSDTPTIHIGGRVEHRNRSTVGALGALVLGQLNTDIAFISASSWSIKQGVTTPEPAKVEIKRAAIAGAAESVLVADSSKYGSFSAYRATDLRNFHTIVTDDGLSEPAASAIQQLGVELMLGRVAPPPVNDEARDHA